ncbi:MAG: hypothetical protein U0931_36245 [Vulcanimicrobiota bacterium]
MKAFLFCLLAATPVAAQPLRLTARLEESPIRLGTIPLFELKVSNSGQETVVFEYYRPTFWYPLVKDSRGKQYSAQFPPYDGPAQKVRLTLRPGQSQLLQSNRCLFTQQPGKPDEAFIQLSPGLYSIHFEIEKLRSPAIQATVVAR